MDPATDVPQDAENIVAIPSEEVGPSTPQEMVVVRFYTVQQQGQDPVQWPLSQEENGPHLPEELCMAPLSP